MATDMVGNYLKKKAYGSNATPAMQTIPARKGVATFVPAGSTIKIVNTSGDQVIDTWAFALPNPPEQHPKTGETRQPAPEPEPEPEPEQPAPKKDNKKSKGGLDLPSQEDAEKATAEGVTEDSTEEQKKKSGWSSYLPSMGLSGKTDSQKKETKKQNSRTWGEYLGAGQSYANYIPSKDDVSKFASSHARDPNKSYIEQLTDFSRTPVGSAGISALSGSGYASSLYAGYSAWSAGQSGGPAPMEYMSMPHTHASIERLVPKVDDTLVSNLREPVLTIVEDTSPGAHDTLISACDPPRYKELGVQDWNQHGSCADNLVLALKELNERAGLKGPKGIGAEVSIHSIPAPLNLFMNVPWKTSGELEFAAPKGKAGDYIRLRAERDVVVVMSSCPNDVQDINNKTSEDAHFVVQEGDEDEDVDIRSKIEKGEQKKATQSSAPAAPKAKAPPKKITPAAKSSESTPAAPAAKKPAAQSAAPAKSRTPIGQTKTPVGQKKAAPAPAAAASKAPAPAKSRTPIGSVKKAPAAASDAKPAATEGAAAPVEKKKPRKLNRQTPAPSSNGD